MVLNSLTLSSAVVTKRNVAVIGAATPALLLKVIVFPAIAVMVVP